MIKSTILLPNFPIFRSEIKISIGTDIENPIFKMDRLQNKTRRPCRLGSSEETVLVSVRIYFKFLPEDFRKNDISPKENREYLFRVDLSLKSIWKPERGAERRARELPLSHFHIKNRSLICSIVSERKAYVGFTNSFVWGPIRVAWPSFVPSIVPICPRKIYSLHEYRDIIA